jgi:hypothetical protein
MSGEFRRNVRGSNGLILFGKRDVGCGLAVGMYSTSRRVRIVSPVD